MAEDINIPPTLRKQSSLGSNLSINQRMANMHHGMPAYHDPPVDGIPPHHTSADNLLHSNDKKKGKGKASQARKSDVRIGNHRGSNGSLNRSGSLPQINRDSLRK
jgi:hypothetical protein